MLMESNGIRELLLDFGNVNAIPLDPTGLQICLSICTKR